MGVKVGFFLCLQVLLSPHINPPSPVSPSTVQITESVHGQLGFLCDPEFPPQFLAIIQQIVEELER